jgi:DNA-binding beta-propeller fold protein YncE
LDLTGKVVWRQASLKYWPVHGSGGSPNGKLLIAENGSGKISVITVNGDKASVTVIKEGLKTPTAVEPDGETIWVAERGTGKAVSIPMRR